MRFCVNCGEQIADNAKFCTNCGERLSPAAAPEISAEPAAEPLPPPIFEEVTLVNVEPAPVSNENQSPPAAPAEEAASTKKKGAGKKFFLIGGIVLAVVIIAVILLAVLGGGADANDPTLGIYKALSCESSGISLDCEGEWIELKAKGKAEICLLGENYSGKWSLDGDKFTLIQAGDEYTGSLNGDELSVDYGGLIYVYVKENQGKPEEPEKNTTPEKPVEPAEPIEPTEPGAPIPDANSPYAWWNGEWYGWWIVQNSTGRYADWEGNYWDAYAIIEEYGDGSGYMQLWDVDYSYDAPMAGFSLSFSPGEGSRGKATADSGYFMDADVLPDSFVSDPDANSLGIEDMIFIEYTYMDPANSDDTIEAYIFLRPWGQDWADVQDGNGENWPYGDMMPLYYYEWYLPLIKHDYPLPHSYQEGKDILSGAENTGSGDILASDVWEECRIDVVGAERFIDWDGKDAIRVYYDFTNTGNVTQYASDIVAINVSQDEYEQHSTSAAWDNTVAEDGNCYLSVRPGVTIRCIAEYHLKLNGGNIVFEFCNYWNDSESFSVEFAPQDLPGRPPQWEEEFISSPEWAYGLPESATLGDYYVSLDHVEIVEDYELDEVFKVVLNFTNNSDEPISFSWALSYLAFQNGIELNTASPSYDAETEADTMIYEEIEPGQSAQVAVCYALRNQQSPVEFEVIDYWTDSRIGNVYELTWGD